MCLLFFNINDNCGDDELRLILVNCRDEMWLRPTKTADFWGNNRCCIGGLDQEPGKEGGTWFGANRHGRIACLVNISGAQDRSKGGRGFLATDFLTKEETMESYANRVASQRHKYNDFILTLIQLGERDSKVMRVTNDPLADSPVASLTTSSQECCSVGNSPINHPWRKVSEGGSRFRKIVDTHRTLGDRDRLKADLFQMMADTHRYCPDPQLQKQGSESDWNQESIDSKAALFVWDPAAKYGTRTTTILLIDKNGNCDYTEKTLHTPVNVNNPQWSIVQYKYTLQNLHSSL